MLFNPDAVQRLEVMKHIHHPEEYYQQALASQGIEYTDLTHEEICVYKATMKAIEADIMIDIATSLPKTRGIEEMDISRIVKTS